MNTMRKIPTITTEQWRATSGAGLMFEGQGESSVRVGGGRDCDGIVDTVKIGKQQQPAGKCNMSAVC